MKGLAFYRSITLFCSLTAALFYLAHNCSPHYANPKRIPAARNPRDAPQLFWVPRSSPREYCNLPVGVQSCGDIAQPSAEVLERFRGRHLDLNEILNYVGNESGRVNFELESRLSPFKRQITDHARFLQVTWETLFPRPQRMRAWARRESRIQADALGEVEHYPYLAPLDNIVLPLLLTRLRDMTAALNTNHNQEDTQTLEIISFWWAARQGALRLACPMTANPQYRATAVRAIQRQAAYQDCRRQLLGREVEHLNAAIANHGGNFTFQDTEWKTVFALASRKERTLYIQIAVRELLPLWIKHLTDNPESRAQFQDHTVLDNFLDMARNEVKTNTVRTWNGEQPADASDLALIYQEILSIRRAYFQLEMALGKKDYRTACNRGFTEFCSMNEGSTVEEIANGLHMIHYSSTFNVYVNRLEELLFSGTDQATKFSRAFSSLRFQTGVINSGFNSGIEQLTRIISSITPDLIEKCIDLNRWEETTRATLSQEDRLNAFLIGPLVKEDEFCLPQKMQIQNYLHIHRTLIHRSQPLGGLHNVTEEIMTRFAIAKRWKEFLNRLPESRQKQELMDVFTRHWPSPHVVQDLISNLRPHFSNEDKPWRRYKAYSNYSLPAPGGTFAAPILESKQLPDLSELFNALLDPHIRFQNLPHQNFY